MGFKVGTKSLTTTAAALDTVGNFRVALIQADPDNSVGILVGDADSQTIQLSAGEDIIIPTDNLNKIYAKSVSGTATLNWMIETL